MKAMKCSPLLWLSVWLSVWQSSAALWRGKATIACIHCLCIHMIPYEEGNREEAYSFSCLLELKAWSDWSIYKTICKSEERLKKCCNPRAIHYAVCLLSVFVLKYLLTLWREKHSQMTCMKWEERYLSSCSVEEAEREREADIEALIYSWSTVLDCFTILNEKWLCHAVAREERMHSCVRRNTERLWLMWERPYISSGANEVRRLWEEGLPCREALYCELSHRRRGCPSVPIFWLLPALFWNTSPMKQCICRRERRATNL